MTAEPICLDANYLVALFDRRDALHGEARAMYGALRDRGALTLTPDCVVNEVLTVYARRCRERNDRGAFAAHVKLLVETIPETAITWLYPHVPRWFAQCVAVMEETTGGVSFHDALLRVAADEVGYKAIVSFDAGFDSIPGLRRLGSARAVTGWFAESSE
jgi:predicted nucleic acid-binding protein